MSYSTCEATDMRTAASAAATAPATRKASAFSIVPAAPAPEGEAAIRRRSRVASILIEHRSFPLQQSIAAKVKPGAILLLAPSNGHLTIVAETGAWTVEPGHVALLCRPQDLTLVWSAGARGDILFVRRDLLQICASRHFGEPRRLAAADRAIKADRAFADALASLIARSASVRPAADSAASGHEADFHSALLAFAERQDLADELFVDVRSAREAIAYIRANHQRDCSPVALAAVAGVTERTLRERFRQCLGVSIASFVQEVRLDWAHGRLITARESRSINDLARAAGFQSAGAFSRSYVRRFGEPATQTRMRAVKEAGSI